MESKEMAADVPGAHHASTSPTTASSSSGAGAGAPVDRIKTTYRDHRCLKMAALQYLVKPFRPRFVASSKKMPSESMQLRAPRMATGRCHWSERRVDGIYIYDMTGKRPPSAADHPKKRIYYFCGGSWQQPPSMGHWRFVAELSQRIPNSTLSIISHPLAPDAPACKAMPQLATLYRTLMAEAQREGQKVIFAGDSSGGNIALTLTLWMITEGHPSPDAVLAICSTTDLRHADPAILAAAAKDPIMTAQFVNEAGRTWMSDGIKETKRSDFLPLTAGPEWSASDPRISPWHGQLERFAECGVKVHGLIAGYDVLCPEARAFREKLNAVGVEGEWLEWDKQMHCFPMVFGIGMSECDQSLDWIVDVLIRT